jgi:hypothetical protein
VNDNNVLITGTPRSGTTLTCHLLNMLPETVALNEPMRGSQFRAAEDVCDVVARFCAEQRTSILERKRAFSKQAGSVVPDNAIGTRRTGSGRRERLVAHGEIIIDKELLPNFILAVKQPGPFTATLNQLVTCFPVYAVVRNPLATLASWESADFVGQRGHFPVVERFDHDLHMSLAGTADELDRQIQLLGWFHARIRRYLPDEAIIHYEAIVETCGKALAVVQPAAAALEVPLESRNTNELYDREHMLRLGERLLRSKGGHWELYSQQSVEQLLGELTATSRSYEAQPERSRRR